MFIGQHLLQKFRDLSLNPEDKEMVVAVEDSVRVISSKAKASTREKDPDWFSDINDPTKRFKTKEDFMR